MADPTDDDGFVADDDGFVPDAPTSATNINPKAGVDTSLASTVAHHIPQGYSYATTDEMVGALGALGEGAEMVGRKVGLLPALTEEEDAFAGTNPAAGAGVGTRMMDAYNRERNEERRQLDVTQEANPKTAIAAELVGGVASPGPKGAAVKGIIPKMGQMAKFGLKAGTVAGIGGSKADLTKGEILPLLADAGMGAGLGTVTGAVSGWGSAKLEPYLKKLAEMASFRSLNPKVAMGGGDKLKKLRARSPTEDPLKAERELGRRALDEGVIVPFGTSEGAAKRSGRLAEEAGEAQGGFASSIQDANPTARANPLAVARALDQQAAEAGKSSATQAYAAYLRNHAKAMRTAALNRLESEGTALMTIPQAEAEKRALQTAAQNAYLNPLKKGSPANEAKRVAASAMRQASEDAVERVAGPEDLAQFLAMKKRTGQLGEINDIAGYGATRAAHSGSEGTSALADAIGRRSEDSSHGPTAWLFNHATDALGHAWKERAPATKAVGADWLSRKNLAEPATQGSIAEYLRFLNEEKDTP